MLEKYGGKKTTGNRFNQHKQNMTGSKTNLQDEGENKFKLEDKITARSQAILLMQMGYLNSYVDFFYITSHPDGAPSAIEINQKLQ